MRNRLGLVLWGCLLLSGGSAVAHHSQAMFDRSKPVTLKGVVKKFEWTNPHILLEMLVQEGNGAGTEYFLEGLSPGVLRRQGWSFEVLKPGDKIVAVMYPLYDGRPGGRMVSVTTADGKVFGTAAPPPAPAPAR